MEKKTAGILSAGADACIHCHLCRKNCEFLKKYEIDIGDTEQLRRLAYHCFLCGACARVCPKGIDGREVVLNLRRELAAQNGGRPPERGYGLLLFEKERYLFRNYKDSGAERVLFPGCNFPSFYPETTRYLAGLLKSRAGMGTVFDCCGKPVAELGLLKQEKRITGELNRRLERAGVKEVAVVCPNCYHFLKGRLNIKVTGIYETLASLGLGNRIEEELTVFPPCPDRESRELLSQLGNFLKYPPKVYEKAQCCGLGGCAAGKERELSRAMAGVLETEPGKKEKEGPTAVYCASCAGSLKRKGWEGAEHVLANILGTGEKADVSGSLLNRAKFCFWRVPEGKA